MAVNTRFGSALLGALLMFFLGSNLTLISEYTGLVPQRILRWFGSSLSYGGSDGGKERGGKGSGSGSGSGGRSKKARVDPSAELLQRVLTDDSRELCTTRYPAGLFLTPEQVDFVHSQRYFVVLTLRNNEEMLHHTLHELLHLIAKVGPSNVFVSVFENNSKDKTPQFLAFFTDMLKLAGVQHHLVSSLTWGAEIEAAKAEIAAAAAAAAAATKTTTDPASPTFSSIFNAASTTKGRLLQEEVEENTMTDTTTTTSAATPTTSSSTLKQQSYSHFFSDQEIETAKGHGLTEEQLELIALGLQEADGRGDEEEADTEAEDRGEAQKSRLDTTNQNSNSSSSSSSSSTQYRGRILAETTNINIQNSISDAGDILSLDAKWKGNRIEFLARIRNWAVRPLIGQPKRYQKLILMNDAYVCSEDILRLILHRDADVACGLDFDTTSAYGIGFYDTWVDRDIHGEPFKKHPPFIQRGPDADRVKVGKPFPVFCCWNGILVANAQPFYEGMRFRRAVKGECAASECSLFCKDYWKYGQTRFLIDPHVRVAYDLPTYNGLHRVNWLQEGPIGASAASGGTSDTGSNVIGTNRSSVDWPEDIPFPPHGPSRVYCCGLEGDGRDADQPCVRETLDLPRPPIRNI